MALQFIEYRLIQEESIIVVLIFLFSDMQYATFHDLFFRGYDMEALYSIHCPIQTLTPIPLSIC